MKIAFINVSLRPDSKRKRFPVGLAYIMTSVQRAGFEFDLIDMDIDNLSMTDFENIISTRHYDVFAFGCIVTGFRWVKELASIIKRVNPDANIIAGNSVATSIPDILLNNTLVDIAVMGEGDITIVELLKAMKNKKDLREVRGISYKNGDNVVNTGTGDTLDNLDVIGFPDWDIFDIEKYRNYGKVNANTFSEGEINSFPLNSARGCPFNCTFCYHVFKDDKYRKYSEDAVIEEIEKLHHNYNCNFISFWDELTFSNIKSITRMLERLNGLDFEIGWEAPVRGNLLRKEHVSLIREMKTAGAECIAFSLENADPEILKAMNKKMNVSQFIEQAKALWEGGVTPLTSVIFGYPQETPETIQSTLDVCEKCNIFPSVGFLLPLPGTSIYEWAKGNGHIVNELEYLERIGDRQDFNINLTKMSDEEFVGTVTTKLETLAKRQGLDLESVFKTVTYQKPKVQN